MADPLFKTRAVHTRGDKSLASKKSQAKKDPINLAIDRVSGLNYFNQTALNAAIALSNLSLSAPLSPLPLAVLHRVLSATKVVFK